MCQVLITATVDEAAPGLKSIFSFRAPDQNSGKVGLSSSLFNPNPSTLVLFLLIILTFFHTDWASVFTWLRWYQHQHGIDSEPHCQLLRCYWEQCLGCWYWRFLGHQIRQFHQDQCWPQLHQGWFNCFPYPVSQWIPVDERCGSYQSCLFRNDKGDSVNASYYHIVNPLFNTAVGAEVNHKFSTKVNTITVGTQHSIDPLTIVKARVNSAGIANALIQHQWTPRSFFTISAEVDTKAIDKNAKVGLALSLKPWEWATDDESKQSISTLFQRGSVFLRMVRWF